ncbi:MAG: hypothetical protein LBQ77_05165 [Treponema sp.]|jgi:hypothetical protein|nr:hypothetical protein [Treponema sp.]
MKKYVCIAAWVVFLSGIAIAEEHRSSTGTVWDGTVRFNPMNLMLNLNSGLPGIDVTWTHYIMPNLGIPLELDIAFGWGLLPAMEAALLSGVEYISLGPREKNGLFLSAKAGVSLYTFNSDYYNVVKFACDSKIDVGYQLLSQKGFVFTPAVGLSYNTRSGFGVDIMLDTGFAYKGKTK